MTTTGHSAIPPVSTQVSETEAMNQRIRERGECVWESNKTFPFLRFVPCLGRSETAYIGGWKFCAFCGKRIIVK